MTLIEILGCFERGADRLTASAIASLSGVPRSSAYRAIDALQKEGFVQKDPGTRLYTLGPRVLHLGSIARRQLSGEHIVAAPVLDLARRTGETVTFSYIDGALRVCAYVIEGPSELRQVAQVGARYQLHLGAAGKVILAHLGVELVEETLRGYGLPRAEVASIKGQLDRIRTLGYAFTSGERVPGAATVAAPVFVRGEIYGSVAVSGPSTRMKPMLEKHRPLVVDVARVISRRLDAIQGSRADDRGHPRKAAAKR